MRRNGIDFITLSPLVLLAFLPVSGWFAPYFTQTAAHPEIVIQKYFSIPLVGFSLGCVLFLGIIRNGWGLPAKLSSYVEQHTIHIISFVACILLIYLSTLAVLRYTSLHSSVFDMGIYDKKIWRISVASLSAIPSEVSQGHFQPILIFYALVYKVIDSPVIIQVSQATAMVSGVVPLYLIAKEHLHKPLLVLLISIIYLLYPPVEFNAALDFHPDHLYVPLLLWAFYFAEKGNYWKGILFAGFGAMIKEPLILGTAFFGLYLILAKKKYLIGTSTFIIFIFMFSIVVFFVRPYINQVPTLEHTGFSFADTTSMNGGSKIDLLMDTLLMWKARKLLFIYFLFAPLLFLPLLGWKRLLPAVPLIVIPFMSTISRHSSIDSQYTVGIIAPAFVALIFSFKMLEERLGLKYVNAFVTLVFIMTLTFNIANGPSLISMNFWKTGWAEIWHKSAFSRGEHEDILEEIIHKVPSNPTIVVASQANINHARLAHRYEYWLFPDRWEDVDYIILDTKRPLMVGDYVDKEMYYEVLQKIENDPRFNLEFEQDGVLLYKKSK